MRSFIRSRATAGICAAVIGLAAGAVGAALVSSARAQSPAGASAAPGNRAASQGYTVADKTLWVIEATPVDTAKETQFFHQHIDRQLRLEKEGVLFAAGPARQVDGDDHFGLIIIRAANATEAKKIADGDPMHINGARRYKLYRWTMNEGSFQLKAVLSNGTLNFQ